MPTKPVPLIIVQSKDTVVNRITILLQLTLIKGKNVAGFGKYTLQQIL